MELAPPSLDIPISKLLVEVQWPEGYDVHFKGSGHEVKGFSQSLPQPVSHDVGTEIVEATTFNFNKPPAHIPRTGVNVTMPRAGQCHRFEQLLVVDGRITLTAEYRVTVAEPEQPSGWLARLHARCCSHRRQAN